MNEYLIGFTAVGSLIGLALGCMFYMMGGRSGKWLRRFIGSLVISTTLWVCALIMGKFNWWILGTYPILALGFSLGYGADIPLMKIIKRAIVASCVVLAGLLCAITYGGSAWMVLILHFGVALWTVFLGVKNPIQAASEEVFVCALLNLGLMMYPFIN